VEVGDKDVHARSLKYSNPIDTTLALALKGMHGPELKDTRHHPDRYYAPTVLSMTWHEPIPEKNRTTEKGFLVVYEIGGGSGYLIEAQAGKEYWTIGVKAFEKELMQIFQPDHHWKIDYTTGKKIRSMLKSIGVYEQNLSPRFDEETGVRDYPDDYEAAYRARNADLRGVRVDGTRRFCCFPRPQHQRDRSVPSLPPPSRPKDRVPRS